MGVSVKAWVLPGSTISSLAEPPVGWITLTVGTAASCVALRQLAFGDCASMDATNDQEDDDANGDQRTQEERLALWRRLPLFYLAACRSWRSGVCRG